MKTLLKNAWLLTLDDAYTDLPDGWLLTENGCIAALGNGPAPDGADEVIDCRGGLLLPGFVNTHCHASMVPFRTMGDDCPDRLRRFLFPLEQEAWTKELSYLGAKYAAAEMLLSGVTTVVDMYYYEEEVIRAFLEMGLRSFPGETVICQKAPGSDTPEEALARSEALLKEWAGSEWVHPIVAPHGTTTVSPDILQRCQALAEKYDTLLTLHACEMDDEMRHFAAKNQTPRCSTESVRGALAACDASCTVIQEPVATGLPTGFPIRSRTVSATQKPARLLPTHTLPSWRLMRQCRPRKVIQM